MDCPILVTDLQDQTSLIQGHKPISDVIQIVWDAM